MTDFFSYVVFMFIGMLLASFFGWMFSRWWFERGSSQSDSGWLQAVIAALIAMFSAR